MSRLQDHYPVICEGKKVYVPTDLLSVDDVCAIRSKMHATATNLLQRARRMMDTAEDLVEHSKELEAVADRSSTGSKPS